MNKNTANSQQFLGRVGNSSTKPSARGVNLLGWGEQERLTEEQRVECLRARVRQLNAAVALPGLSKHQKKEMGQEIFQICNELKEAAKQRKAEKGAGQDVSHFLLDVARENTPRLTWERWVKEAQARFAAQPVEEQQRAALREAA